MRLSRVMDELGAALEAIDGLRVFPYSADRVTPPAAIVGWPDEVTYDDTLGRGMDSMRLPVWVVVGKVDARSTRDTLAVYLDGAGPSSVKAAIEKGLYTACDSVRVLGVPQGVESVSIAGIDYLAAVFALEVSGKGA